jgi:peptidoglycan hydrolase CwlO-like protein
VFWGQKETPLPQGRSSELPAAHTRGRAVAFGALIVVIIALAVSVAAATLRPTPAAAASNREVARLAAQVSSLDAQISGQVSEYAAAVHALDTVRATIKSNRRTLGIASFNLMVARHALQMRLVILYKQQSGGVLDVLFNSADFGDAMAQVDAVQRLTASDVDVARELAGYERDIENQTVKLKADEQSLVKLVADLKSKMAAINASLVMRTALLAGARADVAAAALHQAPPPPPPVVPGGAGQGPWWPLIKQSAAANGVSAIGMYRLMMIESGGSATASNGGHYIGLFQYAPRTWAGSWNPWRTASITDGAAQIKATGHALKLGYGPSCWAGTYSWAFGTN